MLWLLSLAALAAAQDPAPPPADLPDVVVIRPEDGDVTLDCAVTVDGRLVDCRVVSERPPERGFGEAALLQATRARLSPQTMEQARTRARVTFTFRPARSGTGDP